MIGTVISADMDMIGQLQPNTPVRFVKVEMDQALAARNVRAGLLAEVRSSLKSTA
jgi:allophanate hydrolase subunit 2